MPENYQIPQDFGVYILTTKQPASVKEIARGISARLSLLQPDISQQNIGLHTTKSNGMPYAFYGTPFTDSKCINIFDVFAEEPDLLGKSTRFRVLTQNKGLREKIRKTIGELGDRGIATTPLPVMPFQPRREQRL